MVCAWVPTLVPTLLCVTLLVSECQNCLPQKCRFLLLFIFLYLFLPPPFSIGRDFWRVHYFTFGKGHLRGQQWLCSSWISYLRDQLFGKVIFGRKIPNICVTIWRSNVGKRKHLQMRNLCTGTGIHLQNTQTTHWQWWFSQSLWIVWNISNWQPFKNRDSRNMMPVVAESAFQVKILKTFYWGKNFVACNLFID